MSKLCPFPNIGVDGKSFWTCKGLARMRWFFVNGKRCGEVRWTGGEVDITEFVQPGQIALLRLLVVATPDERQVPDLFAGRLTTLNFQGWHWVCGIPGEVFLHSRPKGACIADMFVQPSVRRRELVVTVDLANVAQSGTVRTALHQWHGARAAFVFAKR